MSLNESAIAKITCANMEAAKLLYAIQYELNTETSYICDHEKIQSLIAISKNLNAVIIELLED